MSELSEYGTTLARSVAMTFELLKEHAKQHPAEVDAIYRSMVSHIRNHRAQVFTSLDTGPIDKVPA